MGSSVSDDTGLLLRVKRHMSGKAYRAITRPIAAVLRRVPPTFNYAIGLTARRSKYPYKLIEPTDTVVQIGAPRDLLAVGRSRSIYFALMAERGRTIIIEPDPENIAAMRQFVTRMGLQDRVTVVPSGAWSKKDTLVFLSSPEHPASNLLADVVEDSNQQLGDRHYDEIRVPVDSVDSILASVGAGVPKIVSITTNGAEKQILEGMTDTIARGCKYVAFAATEEGLADEIARRGLKIVAYDDRGYTFEIGGATGAA